MSVPASIKYDEQIAARLTAFDRAAAALKQILTDELEAEPELLFAGEATIDAWRLELDAGGFSVSLVAPDNVFLGWPELSRLGDLAVEHELDLRVRPSTVGGVRLTARVNA